MGTYQKENLEWVRGFTLTSCSDDQVAIASFVYDSLFWDMFLFHVTHLYRYIIATKQSKFKPDLIFLGLI